MLYNKSVTYSICTGKTNQTKLKPKTKINRTKTKRQTKQNQNQKPK